VRLDTVDAVYLSDKYGESQVMCPLFSFSFFYSIIEYVFLATPNATDAIIFCRWDFQCFLSGSLIDLKSQLYKKGK
jgi:hypothetical protein